MLIVRRRGKDKNVPKVIHTYNNLMGGVGRSDQMLSSYPVERKRLKKWSKKMWLHLLNTCIFNAHILHCKLGGNLDPFRFRKNLISQIIEKYGSDTENTRSGAAGHPCVKILFVW